MRDVVHQDLEFAKSAHGLLDEQLRCIFLRGRFLAQIDLQAVDENFRTFGDAALRDGFVDAGDTASDEDDLVVESVYGGAEPNEPRAHFTTTNCI